jgi:hypothetical protein
MQFAATIALGLAPLLVFGAAAMLRPAPPVPVKPVATEGVRMIRMDDATFRRRWAPLNDLPPATEVRYVREDVVSAVPVATALQAPQPRRLSRHRPALRTKPVRLDVCARHKMHRVNYTRPNGWPYWRCRR